MPRIIQEYREEVRKKIVEVAYGLFIEKGYNGTTMDDIANRLGVTKPAIYQYFPGKESLYGAVSDIGRADFAGILNQSYKGRSIREGSIILFDTLIRYLPRFNIMYLEMTLLAERNEELKLMILQDRAKDLQVIEKFIAQQQEKGFVSRSLDSRTLAVACDALVYGLLMDINNGLDVDEAKIVWISALERLTSVD